MVPEIADIGAMRLKKRGRITYPFAAAFRRRHLDKWLSRYRAQHVYQPVAFLDAFFGIGIEDFQRSKNHIELLCTQA
jgi:hypothetical protein